MAGSAGTRSGDTSTRRETIPRRHKARVWFGFRRYGVRRALQLAHATAAKISAMSPLELRDWWAEYHAAHVAGRDVAEWRAEQRYEDRLDFTDVARISHVFQRRQ